MTLALATRGPFLPTAPLGVVGLAAAPESRPSRLARSSRGGRRCDGGLVLGSQHRGARGPAGGRAAIRARLCPVPASCSVLLRGLAAQPAGSRLRLHPAAAAPEPRRRRLTAVACRGPGSASRRPVRCVVTCVRAQLPGSVCCAGSSLGLRPGGAGARGAVSAGHSGRLLEAEPALSGGRGGGSELPSGTAPPWASSPSRSHQAPRGRRSAGRGGRGRQHAGPPLPAAGTRASCSGGASLPWPRLFLAVCT